MAMSNGGLTKLTEECGELVQIASKKIAYPNSDAHPDGKGSIKRRIEEEIGDVFAACAFVIEKFGLNMDFIVNRAEKKLLMFKQWDMQD